MAGGLFYRGQCSHPSFPHASLGCWDSPRRCAGRAVMGLTLEAEQRMEKVGLVALFEKNRKIWVGVYKKSYSFVRDGFPPGSIIRRDDVQKTLIPVLEVH